MMLKRISLVPLSWLILERVGGIELTFSWKWYWEGCVYYRWAGSFWNGSVVLNWLICFWKWYRWAGRFWEGSTWYCWAGWFGKGGLGTVELADFQKDRLVPLSWLIFGKVCLGTLELFDFGRGRFGIVDAADFQKDRLVPLSWLIVEGCHWAGWFWEGLSWYGWAGWFWEG